MKRLLLGILLCLCLGLSASVALVRDGRGEAEIVLASDSHPAVRYAAEELRHWVKEISGADLPVVSESGNAAVSIRLRVNPKEFSEDLKALAGNDGYAVRQRGKVIHLIATCPKGILNGVYRWVYRNTDIIWARPNLEFGTVFTPRKTLVFTETDYRDVPAYVLRGWQMIGPWNHVPSEEWQVRNCSNWSALTSYDPKRVKYGMAFEYGGGHNLVGRYITERKYYAEHPEFFPLIKGKRVRPSQFSASTQLCFTNQEMVKAFIGEVDERVRANPHYDTYRIMIEDNMNLCECPECMKDIRLADGTVVTSKDKRFRSTQFFLFLNQVARHMQTHYPGKRILTFGYFFTETPPACRVEPNISISFCPIFKDTKHVLTDAENRDTMDRFQGWLKMGADVTWREYFGLVPPFPRPTDATALPDWSYVNGKGVTRTYSEMYADAVGPRMDGVRAWDANAMYFWVMTNGSWNPRRDYRELRKEFLTRVYGEAAPDLQEYYEILEEAWRQSPGKSTWNDSAFGNWKFCARFKDNHKRLRQCLENAKNKNMPDNGKKMLAAVRRNMDDYMEQVVTWKVYVAPTQEKPVFKPNFDDPVWKQSQVYRTFLRNSRKPHEQKTELRLLYDKDNLYVGVRCHHDHVKKMLYRPPTPGNRVFPDGEGFEMFIQGRWTGRWGYAQMIMDPSNNRYTAIMASSWNSQATVTADGWSGMATIPWKSLRMDPKPGAKTTGAFVRQFMRQPQSGHAPADAASLFEGRRHQPSSFIDIILK